MKKRIAVATLVVVLALFTFVGSRAPKSAEAAGPWPTTAGCFQRTSAAIWIWDGFTWRFFTVRTTVCVQFVTFVRPFTPVATPQYFMPMNTCWRPLPWGGFFDACQSTPFMFQGVSYGGMSNPAPYWMGY